MSRFSCLCCSKTTLYRIYLWASMKKESLLTCLCGYMPSAHIHQLFVCGSSLSRHLRAEENLVALLPGGGGGYIAGDTGRAVFISDCLVLGRLSVHTDEPSGNGLVPSSIKIMPLYEHDLRLIITHVLYGHNKNMIRRAHATVRRVLMASPLWL